MNPSESPLYRLLSRYFLDLPHCRAIGLRHEGIEQLCPTLSIDWQPHLVGRSDWQTIHGGAITVLIDVASACAVAARQETVENLATLDMRIDYMHPAEQHRRIYCRAECFRLAGQVAFIRSICYHDDPADPIALGTATFMRTPLTDEQQAQVTALLSRS